MGSLKIAMLGPSDSEVLDQVADDVFDEPIEPKFLLEFLSDPRHHLVVATKNEVVVGFASAVHYVHPDKPNELWVNEIGVAPECQGQGIGKKLMGALFTHGAKLGCSEAWVLADEENSGARHFYKSLGGSESPSVMFSFDIRSESSE